MMDKVNEEREDLKAVLEVGLTVTTIGTIVSYWIKKEKNVFLQKLNELIAEFNKTLNDVERRELRDDLDRAIDRKAEELLTELGAELSEEELDQVVSELKLLSQSP